MEPRRVLIVRNPSAGSGAREEAISDLISAIERHGMVANVVADLEKLGSLAREFQDRGELRAVVAAGGDGTVAEVVNRTDPDIPLTVFPLGTANLLAGYLAISRDPESMAQMLQQDTLVQLDAGRANGRIFVMMASCGFDADVAHRLHRLRGGKPISYWSWAWPILESVRGYHFHELRVKCGPATGDPEASTHRARWAFVVNLPSYAAGLQVAPQAVGTDGMLNVGMFRRGSLWRGLWYVGSVALGQHHKLRDFKATMATHVRLESDKPVPYQLDGDPGGWLPLEIEVLPGRLTVLAPAAQVRKLGFDEMTASSRKA